MDLQQTSPIGAGSKIGLKVMPAGSVALRDGHCPGERTPTRRYLEQPLQFDPLEVCRTGSSVALHLMANARRTSAARNCTGWSRRYQSGLRDRSADFDRSWKLISMAALAAPLASW
jgi:hypothetical protein